MAVSISAKKQKANPIETEGVWVNFTRIADQFVWWLPGEAAPTDDDSQVARLRVARQGNPRAKAFWRRAKEPYRRVIRQTGDLPEEVAQKLLVEMMANTILVDWADIESDGEPVEYSPDAAHELLSASEEFRALVLEISGDLQVYRDERIAEDAETLGN